MWPRPTNPSVGFTPVLMVGLPVDLGEVAVIEDEVGGARRGAEAAPRRDARPASRGGYSVSTGASCGAARFTLSAGLGTAKPEAFDP
jgi:hypothetical protein